MRIALRLATAVALASVATAAHAFTVPGGGGLKDASEESSLIEQAQVFVYGGRNYCFYLSAWNGAGWYRCGYAWRRGFGFGGVYGWNRWYSPRYHSRYFYGRGWDRRRAVHRDHRRGVRQEHRQHNRGVRQGHREMRRDGRHERRGVRQERRGNNQQMRHQRSGDRQQFRQQQRQQMQGQRGGGGQRGMRGGGQQRGSMGAGGGGRGGGDGGRGGGNRGGGGGGGKGGGGGGKGGGGGGR